IYSTDTDVGGDDHINAGAGSDTVIGGVGDDIISAGRAEERGVGKEDNGRAECDDSGDLRKVFRLDAAHRGNDVIDTGGGNNLIIGGSGADQITALDGADVILGDNGQAEFNAAAILTLIYSTDTDVGGDDHINAGAGSDTVIGGVGNDIISAG